MSNVEEIVRQIRELSGHEFAELRKWILEQDWQAWDAEIEADLSSGKLDAILAEAEADFRAGRAREL